MTTITIDLLEFEELGPNQKQKALNTFRDFNLSQDWWDFIYDDFQRIAGFLGIDVDKEDIFFSGFYGQGDGAGFSAIVDLKKLIAAITTEAWKIHAPDLELSLTVPNIDRRVLRLAINGQTGLEPRILKKSRVYGVIADFGGYPANEKSNHDLIWAEIDELEKWLENIGNVLNAFLYKSLENEYDYLTGDNAVAEMLVADGYSFTRDGEPANRLKKLATTN